MTKEIEITHQESVDDAFKGRLKDISDAITDLSARSYLEEVYARKMAGLLKQRNQVIEDYMNQQGWTVKSQLLITRHPESLGKDKIAGLSPDATPSPKGVASLTPKEGQEKTHARNFMHLLARTPDKPIKFARSNMIRAGMFCNMIMDSPHVKVASCVNSSDFQETLGKLNTASTTPLADPSDREQTEATFIVTSENLKSKRRALSAAVNEESKGEL